MQSLYKIGFNFLSNKKVSFFILLLCIVSKSVLIFFYSYTGRDKIYNLSASYNLLHGKGWTNSFFYLEDINKEVLKPFCHWPPGYGLLITPFQMVFGENIFLSTTIFEIMCFVLFILLCRAILKTQKLSTPWLNLYTILLSFFSHDFIQASLGTDLPALVFLFGFFYSSIRIWNSGNQRSAIMLGIIAGICLFFAGFTRYMYAPVCLFIAIVLLVLSHWKKNKIAGAGYLLTLVICFLALGAAMVFQNAACGSPFYTGIEKKGFFLENLEYWHPASIAAFINLDFVPVQLEKFSSVSYSAWLQIFGWTNLVVYFFFVVVASYYFYKVRKVPADGLPIFDFIGFIFSFTIIGELAILSLTNGPQYWESGNTWTFIVEGRYHAFPVVFLQLFFLTKVAQTQGMFKFKSFHKSILSFCFILFLLNCLHQVYFTTKVALNYKSMKENALREQDYVFFESLLVKTKKENPEKDILVASIHEFYVLLASMHNAKGIVDGYKLRNYIPPVTKPSVLITVTEAQYESMYTEYLKNNNVKLIKEVAGTRIYIQLLNSPDQK